MENSRRVLRTKNNCPQIANIFNCKTGQCNLLKQIPVQILNKIGQLQKITCCHINELPQLNPSHSFQQQIENCRLAQEFQKFNTPQSTQNSPIQVEKATGCDYLREHILKHHHINEEDRVEVRRQRRNQGIRAQESRANQDDVWKDLLFLENLNEFVMLSGHNRLAMPQQLLEK